MLRCLDALLAQDHPSYEILVLDNGSTDGTAEACRDRGAGATVPVSVHSLPGSVGALRNRAAELAVGELIAFTDSDCLPEPGWLSAAAAEFDDPGVGVVCGRTLPEEPIEQGWPATIEVTELTMRFESCNVIFRRDAFRRSGGFDETVGHYWEDTAAGFAMLREGWKVAFAEDAVVRHDVTYPGFVWHLRRALKNANLGPVVARYPEIRRELFWMRIFFRPRNAKFVGFLVAMALARRHRAALLLAAPYAWMRRPRRADPAEVKVIAQGVLYDGAVLAGLLLGAARSGRIVL